MSLSVEDPAPSVAAPSPPRALSAQGRAWFDPREGVAAMKRADWLIASALTIASFVVLAAWVQWPAEKYFDEIYYARAGEEYLRHVDASGWGPFEFTHPPLTKLLITLSMLAFGGLHGLGDTAVGWRFWNVVAGALTVGLLYAFAKRLTGSTLFASLGALMLACDGFHFVQSRIATPEITVALLSLLTLYAFYRLWIATQVARGAQLGSAAATRALGITMAAGVVVAAIAALLVPGHSGPVMRGADFIGWAQGVVFAWTIVLFWLIARTFVVPHAVAARITSYPDGTRIDTDGTIVASPDDGDPDLVRTVDADGTLTYAAPAVMATYRLDDARPHEARVWWFVLAVSGALLTDAKWNGLFDVAVVWFIAALVAAQRWLRFPARFGNPFGMPVDVIAAGMVVAGGIVYTLSYIPYFTLGHGFVDMVAMQHDMYRYHATLVATHPWSSVWWQWPLLDRPILYYYQDSRSLTQGAPAEHLCCVASILALPNPFVWWAGLVSVPLVAWWAIRDRNKGYALLAVAYLFQWLPWIGSPRLSFEYHFYPNLAIIVLANAIVLQRVWRWGREANLRWPGVAVVAYAVVVVLGFGYFYPVLAGIHVPWDQWHARMWSQRWAS